MSELKINDKAIESMIYEIRGKQVMLDSDLAKLYQCKNGTKDINKAVKRNINRFPIDFYLQLADFEKKELWFQSGTANNMSRTNPFVFTEQGVAMLSSVLRTEIAEEVSIRIMDTFVKMRHYINFHQKVLPNKFLLLEKKVDDNTKRIDELFDKFNPKEIMKDYLFFRDDFYDSYSVIMDILTESLEEVIIIDNYISKELLDIVKDIDRKFIIISENIDEKLTQKYLKQYKNVTFKKCEKIHDRFIILDRYIMYSCGSSLKDVGKKCFAIHEWRDRKYTKDILKEVGLL